MKPYIYTEGTKNYDGEYFHTIIPFGIIYTSCSFSEHDWYKQISIGFILFSLIIGIKK